MKINYKFLSIKFIAIFSLGSLGIIAPLKLAWAEQTSQSTFSGYVTYSTNPIILRVVMNLGKLTPISKKDFLDYLNMKVAEGYSIESLEFVNRRDSNGKIITTGMATLKKPGETVTEDYTEKTMAALNAALIDAMQRIRSTIKNLKSLTSGYSSLTDNVSSLLMAARDNIYLNASSPTKSKYNFEKIEVALNDTEQKLEQLNQVINSLFSSEGYDLNQINFFNQSIQDLRKSLLVLLDESNSIPDNDSKEIIANKKLIIDSINDITSILELVSEVVNIDNKAIAESE